MLPKIKFFFPSILTLFLTISFSISAQQSIEELSPWEKHSGDGIMVQEDGKLVDKDAYCHAFSSICYDQESGNFLIIGGKMYLLYGGNGEKDIHFYDPKTESFGMMNFSLPEVFIIKLH